MPTSETGTAISGISVARSWPRKRKTTMTTSPNASPRVVTTSRTVSLMNKVVS